MPHVTRIEGPKGNAIYQVGGKSFVFFRTPQPDAQDPDTGERYADVIMIWVESEADKLSLIQDPGSPFFTTERFEGHPSVLVRASRLREIGRVELTRAGPGCLAVEGVETPRRPLAGRTGALGQPASAAQIRLMCLVAQSPSGSSASSSSSPALVIEYSTRGGTS